MNSLTSQASVYPGCAGGKPVARLSHAARAERRALGK